MLKIQEIREIIKLVDASSIEEFVYEADEVKVKLKKNSGIVISNHTPEALKPIETVQAAPAVEAPVAKAAPAVEKQEAKTVETASTESLHKIVSPMVGTFYQAPSPDAKPFVQVGDKIGEESIVCIVEAMKLFNEIEAEVKGEIVEILVTDGELVEYGQPLFLVKEN
ncbi:acetyl-CoA carboxylase biotin carboxyl carrier protein [Rummeliibacillus sp. BSL5]